jgi:hypothetical protein
MRRQGDGATTRRRLENKLLAAGTVHATHSAKLVARVSAACRGRH